MDGGGLGSGGVAAGWNALARLFGRAIPLAKGTLVVSEAAPPGAGRRVRAVGDGLQVALDAFPFRAATGVELELDDLAALPPGLADALETSAFDAIRRAVGLPLPEPGAETPATGPLWVSAEVDPGWGAPARLLVGGSREALSRAARRLPDLGPHPLAAAAAEAVSVAMRLELGRLDLDVAHLATLAAGDALVPRPRPRLVAGRLRLGLAHGGDAWTITESHMSDHDDGAGRDDALVPGPAAASAALADLGELPVRLTFVLAERELPLSELRALAQGGLLPFEAMAGASGAPGSGVRILANGRPWGSGTLIDIDGAPAVRIARIDAAPAGAGAERTR